MSNKLGRKGHPPDDKLKFEIFVCSVLEELRKLDSKELRGIRFDTMTWGRDDIEEIREEINKRWKK